MKMKTDADADVNITALIDCLMQCIIFFMVIMSAQYVYGVAIKFPAAGSNVQKEKSDKQEKNIIVYVQSDWIEADHRPVQDGILKLNGEEIALATSKDTAKWEGERKASYEYLQFKMSELIKQGYKKDILIVQGDYKSYHGKIMHVIDIGKDLAIESFSLVPPTN